MVHLDGFFVMQVYQVFTRFRQRIAPGPHGFVQGARQYRYRAILPHIEAARLPQDHSLTCRIKLIGYAQQRRAFLQKHRKISEYDSENLLYTVIESILQTPEFLSVDCAIHVSLISILKDYTLLEDDEMAYARNPLTHVDFLLFRRMDKSPLLAIEADGTAYHSSDSIQAERDQKKGRIFEKCGIPLLRFRTDGSGEREKIQRWLRQAAENS